MVFKKEHQAYFCVRYITSNETKYKLAKERYSSLDDRIFELNVNIEQGMLALTPNLLITKSDPDREKPDIHA